MVLDVSDIPDELQDQFYDHQNLSSARDFFSENGTFSVIMCYARIPATSIRAGFLNITFFFFNILCLYESGLSALVHIKNESAKSKKT